mmetsp:Transcript_37467/g.92708  ORF Transcript_37467/g.92708 Transcript_37467/m.92708 type:complete len:367 (-) Transcript_37467:88-1188(-)
MREVICGVDAVLVLGVWVSLKLDAISRQVPHGRDVRPQVTLHAQAAAALLPHPLAHLVEQLKVLLHGAVAVWGLSARGQWGLVALHVVAGTVHLEPLQQLSRCRRLGLGLMAHVCFAHLDELHRVLVQLVEVVGGVRDLEGLVPQPLHGAQDGVDVLLLLRRRVGVIKPQVCVAAKPSRDAEIKVHGFGVSNVEVAVGFGGEAGLPLASSGSEVRRHALGRVHRKVLGDRGEVGLELRHEVALGARLGQMHLFLHLLLCSGSLSSGRRSCSGRVLSAASAVSTTAGVLGLWRHLRLGRLGLGHLAQRLALLEQLLGSRVILGGERRCRLFAQGQARGIGFFLRHLIVVGFGFLSAAHGDLAVRGDH